MARVRGRDRTGADLQNTRPDRHEHILLITGADGFVGLDQNISGALSQHGAALEDDLGNHHEQGRRYTLAADIRHDHTQVVGVDQEEIIEITADFSGRFHRRVNIKFPAPRERREYVGQHTVLDPVGHLQLCADPFLLPGDLGNILYILSGLSGLVLKSLRQNLNLIIRPIGILHFEDLA